MPDAIPASHRDLLDKKALAFLACHLANGAVMVNPVWCMAEDGHVLINSAQGRLKDKVMRRDPRVTLCIVDPDDPFRYLELRGKVTEITDKGADAVIDRLAKKYLGVDTYPYRRAGEKRLTYRIAPEKVVARGN
jgi:PPOX class probable F420-dependent enzyme